MAAIQLTATQKDILRFLFTGPKDVNEPTLSHSSDLDFLFGINFIQVSGVIANGKLHKTYALTGSGKDAVMDGETSDMLIGQGSDE